LEGKVTSPHRATLRPTPVYKQSGDGKNWHTQRNEGEGLTTKQVHERQKRRRGRKGNIILHTHPVTQELIPRKLRGKREKEIREERRRTKRLEPTIITIIPTSEMLAQHAESHPKYQSDCPLCATNFKRTFGYAHKYRHQYGHQRVYDSDGETTYDAPTFGEGETKRRHWPSGKPIRRAQERKHAERHPKYHSDCPQCKKEGGTKLFDAISSGYGF